MKGEYSFLWQRQREIIMRCSGVSRDADDAAIKKAYRALAKKYHPDMNPGDKEAEKNSRKLQKRMPS